MLFFSSRSVSCRIATPSIYRIDNDLYNLDPIHVVMIFVAQVLCSSTGPTQETYQIFHIVWPSHVSMIYRPCR